MGDYKVYLGNIPDDTRDRDVEKLFKSYGRIRNVVIKRNEQGTYGFCEFDDMRDAQDAVKDLDGTRFLGSRIKIEHARDSRAGGRGRRSPPRRKGNPPGKRTGFKLIVENLSTRTSWQDLKDYMRQAGEIMYTNTHHMRSGEGVVEFGSRSDMEWALDKLDGTELDGRKITFGHDGVTTPFALLKIEGEGMPHRGDPTNRGNMIVKCKIKMPEDGRQFLRENAIGPKDEL